MIYRLLADIVLTAHLVFVLFVLFGGLLALRYPKAPWFHLPALLWGIIVQSADLICPLTPLENRFRMFGGEAGYAGGFVEHVVSKLLYPDSLTLELRYLLAILLLAVNVAVYAYLIATRIRRKQSQQTGSSA